MKTIALYFLTSAVLIGSYVLFIKSKFDDGDNDPHSFI